MTALGYHAFNINVILILYYHTAHFPIYIYLQDL